MRSVRCSPVETASLPRTQRTAHHSANVPRLLGQHRYNAASANQTPTRRGAMRPIFPCCVCSSHPHTRRGNCVLRQIVGTFRVTHQFAETLEIMTDLRRGFALQDASRQREATMSLQVLPLLLTNTSAKNKCELLAPRAQQSRFSLHVVWQHELRHEDVDRRFVAVLPQFIDSKPITGLFPRS